MCPISEVEVEVQDQNGQWSIDWNPLNELGDTNTLEYKLHSYYFHGWINPTTLYVTLLKTICDPFHR